MKLVKKHCQPHKVLFFVSILLVLTKLFGINIPQPTTYKYINDYVGVVENDVIEKIVSVGRELEVKTGAQITAVVLKTLGDTTIEEYAVELFRKWGIGQKDKDNGVLILAALDDREMRIEVGYGLEGAIPDGKAGRIRDEYIIPYFKEGNYSKGIYYGYLAIAKEVAKEYNVELSFDVNTELKDAENGNENIWPEIIFFIVLFTFIIIPAILGSNYKGPMGPGSFRGPGTFGGFGGFGGGSNSKGSGGSFGGFGGGKSGGGGASGKW
ncbi:MAG: TPM domain-containing protein [Fervidobacterium nodosum]